MKRPEYLKPDYIVKALGRDGLRALYDQRPWYQRNDYIGWIERAKREDTTQKRLKQMLDELKSGDVYMKMAWRPRR